MKYPGRLKSTFTNQSSTPSRGERRRLEREARKQRMRNEKVTQGSPVKESHITDGMVKQTIRSALQLKWLPNPRIRGGTIHLLDSRYRNPLAIRFVSALVFIYFIENEDLSPYITDMAVGPSMLPTLPSLGGICLRETGAWYRFLGFPIKYNKGDVVVFRDQVGRHVGKRIIGVEGDAVLRYGEYVNHYLDRADWGIAVASTKEIPKFEDEDEIMRDPRRKIIIPKNHVWLEGDLPPFSVDSRHYGPIPVHWIRGRVIARVWPWNGYRLSKSRPIPLSVAEALSGRYNLVMTPNEVVERNESFEQPQT